MSEELVRSTLTQHADENLTSIEDPWPAIRNRLAQFGSPAGAPIADTYSTRQTPERRWQTRSWAFAAAGVLLVLAAVLAYNLLATEPAPVSAEQIWARAEQVAKNGTGAGLQSAHIVTEYRRSFMGLDGTVQGRAEVWYKAPNSLLSKAVQSLPGGIEQQSFSLDDDAGRYFTVPGWDIVFLVAPGGDHPRMFSPIDLGELLQRGTQFGNREDVYSVTLAGTEEVAGREAYVIERVFRPESLGNNGEVLIHRARLWIDREYFVVLQIRAWDAKGKLVDETNCVNLQLNAPVDPALFRLEVPAGMYVTDMRPADKLDIAAGWRDVAKSVNGTTLYAPVGLPDYLVRSGKPYAQGAGVVTQAIVRSDRATMLHALVVQGPIGSIPSEGSKQASPERMGDAEARIYNEGGLVRLLLDKGQGATGTRILLLSTNAHSENDLREIARSLEPVASD